MIWCLHGALGSHCDWQSTVAAPELRAWSPQSVNLWQDFPRIGLEEWALDWSKSIAQQDPAPVLLGYSMGGRLALHAALASPIWRAVVIVSAHTGLVAAGDRQQRRAHDERWLEHFQTLAWPSFLERWNQQAIFSGHSHPLQPRPHPAMTRCFQQWSLSQQEALQPKLPGIQCPLLWIVGERDSKFQTIAKQAVPQLPQGSLAIAPNCGHRVPWEWPDFAATVATFLNGRPTNP